MTMNNMTHTTLTFVSVFFIVIFFFFSGRAVDWEHLAVINTNIRAELQSRYIKYWKPPGVVSHFFFLKTKWHSQIYSEIFESTHTHIFSTSTSSIASHQTSWVICFVFGIRKYAARYLKVHTHTFLVLSHQVSEIRRRRESFVFVLGIRKYTARYLKVHTHIFLVPVHQVSEIRRRRESFFVLCISKHICIWTYMYINTFHICIDTHMYLSIFPNTIPHACSFQRL